MKISALCRNSLWEAHFVRIPRKSLSKDLIYEQGRRRRGDLDPQHIQLELEALNSSNTQQPFKDRDWIFQNLFH